MWPWEEGGKGLVVGVDHMMCMLLCRAMHALPPRLHHTLPMHVHMPQGLPSQCTWPSIRPTIASNVMSVAKRMLEPGPPAPTPALWPSIPAPLHCTLCCIEYVAPNTKKGGN